MQRRARRRCGSGRRDLVSLLTASQFAAHAIAVPGDCAEAMAVQEQLATTLGISAGSYAATEAANAATIA